MRRLYLLVCQEFFSPALAVTRNSASGDPKRSVYRYEKGLMAIEEVRTTKTVVNYYLQCRTILY